MQILKAARACFASLGFQGTSVDRIATKAGVSVGLLYRFFESKAAIVEAIIIEELEAQLAQLKDALDSGSLDAERFSNLIKRGIDDGSMDPDRMAMMFEISAEICRNAKLRAFVHDRHAQLRTLVRDELIRKGATEEEAAETFHRVDLASAILTTLGMRSVLHSDPLSRDLSKDAEDLIDSIFALDRKRLQ
jgi:TetR/AcrR family transcriptional repressor of uid operon